MNEITYRHILLKDLVPWAEEIVSKAGEGDFVPITLHRAEAMAANPYGAPEDVSMIAAYLGEKCVGYFGVMPIYGKAGGCVGEDFLVYDLDRGSGNAGDGRGKRVVEIGFDD